MRVAIYARAEPSIVDRLMSSAGWNGIWYPHVSPGGISCGPLTLYRQIDADTRRWTTVGFTYGEVTYP